MENKVRKSLFDKNIAGFEYNPQIVSNIKTKTIKDRLIRNLKESKRINIAVSYIVWSGLSLIYNDLKKFDKNSKILVTTEGFVTDPRSLRKLLELGLQVRVYEPYTRESKGFHLKSYFFEKQNYSTILIGSNNISARAFGLAHEMAVEVDSSDEGMFVSKYEEVFDQVWNDPSSQDLTEEFIKGYENVYKWNKESLETQFIYGLNDEDVIKPNSMQQDALEELEIARTNSDKGLVIAATGTGKTYLSAFDVRAANAKKVLFLVHNRIILSSAKLSYERIFKNKRLTTLELNSSNLSEIAEADFIFTTDKTAHKHLYNKVSKDYFDYIIYDEAHRIGEDTLYSDLIDYFEPKFSLGMTATPERTKDSKSLFRTFDYNVVYEIRLLDSLQQELVCPFTYYGLNLDEKLIDTNEEFNYPELAKFIKKLIDEKGFYGEKLKALVFASNIREANAITKALRVIGYYTEVAVSGSSNEEQIEEYILSLQSDEKETTEIIVTVNKFNEGVDIPEINAIFMLRNTTSSIVYLQQLGRGLRKTYDPHKYVTVFDIIGNSKNNYTIAEVLTLNSTADKRQLYKHVGTNFETVSPFINIEIDEKSMENIIRSISNHFKVGSKLKNKFTEELSRFTEIPTLVDMYKNPNFHELDLLQLMHKNFYDPFEKYYNEKYAIPKKNIFIRKIFDFITQFTFRGYKSETLKDYVSLLKGEGTKNKTLIRVLLKKTDANGALSTAIKSDYYKEKYNHPEAFILKDDTLFLNEEVVEKLISFNAYELFKEHVDLFEELSKREDYQMKTFDLVDKGEFLFNVGAKDAYMNVVGERIDHDKKAVYCTIKITEKESHYDNYIIDEDKVVYFTQNSAKKQQAINKINKIIGENYTFYIAAQFPHLGYVNTSYFNLGNVEVYEVSEVKKDKKGKFNHEIVFKLEENLPMELLMYKDERFDLK